MTNVKKTNVAATIGVTFDQQCLQIGLLYKEQSSVIVLMSNTMSFIINQFLCAILFLSAPSLLSAPYLLLLLFICV